MTLRSLRNAVAAALFATACADVAAPGEAPDALGEVDAALVTGVDLQATVTGPTLLPAGATATFTATAFNNGTAKAIGANLQTTVAAGYGVTPGTGCTFNTTSRLLYCSLGNLSSGATRQITYSVTAPLAAGTLQQSIYAGTNSSDVAPTNNWASISTVVHGANLGVTLAAPSSTPAGSAITTLATVTNSGPLAASSVWLTLPVPQGSYPTAYAGCTLASFPTRLRCNLGTVAPGATVTRSVTWGVPYAVAPVTLPASVVGATAEPAAINGNNSTSAVVNVTAVAPVAVTMSLPAPQDMALTNCFGDPGWFGSFAACPSVWKQSGVLTFLDGGVIDTGNPDVTGNWLQPNGPESLEFEFHDAATGDLIMWSEGVGVTGGCYEGLNWWPGDPQGLNRGAFRICTL